MEKYFILDTNILMQSFNALTGFADNNVVIPATVVEELNAHKKGIDDINFNARETLRILKELRERGSLSEGVGLKNLGKLYVINGLSKNFPTIEYPYSINDNKIISTAMFVKEKHPENEVIVVTNDVNVIIKCDNLGIKAQDYHNESVERDFSYEGYRNVSLYKDDIDRLYGEKKVDINTLIRTDDLINVEENEYLIIKAIDTSDSNTVLAYHRHGEIILIDQNKLVGYNDIKPRNIKQKMLMHALLAPASEIPLVVVDGPAGTGKTILSVAAGLAETYNDFNSGHKSYDKKGRKIGYDSVMITRTNVQSDNDLGALPGSLEEKMSPLLRPFLDNLKKIFEGSERDKKTAKQQIDYVLGEGIVEIVAVGYMRGASLEDTFLIVDEAQNMTARQALEIVSRAADNCKIVLLGDPDQIDAKYIDRHNNGLVFTSERMKGSDLCAQITFKTEETVRSKLAQAAAERMRIN